MLKRNITYTNLDDEEVTETFYFNLSKSEMIELDVQYKDGFRAYLEAIVKAENKEQIVGAIKKVILICYGKRDGARFIKSQELRDEFEQTMAYDALFWELATSDTAAIDFIKGVMPKDVVGAVAEELAKVTEIKPS